MTTQERSDRHAQPQDDATAGASAAAPSRTSVLPSGLRVWLLPALKGGVWPVAAVTDPIKTAERLAEGPPVVLHAAGTVPDNVVLQRARQDPAGLVTSARDEAWFRLAKHVLLGGIWVLIGLAGLRIPGVFRFFDEVLLLLGLGYLGYSIFRYGREAAGWSTRLRAAEAAWSGAQLCPHPLPGRLAAALAHRAQLKPEQRGHTPDQELLDHDAYRKLVDAGVISAGELSALGKAVSQRMGLDSTPRDKLKVTELARSLDLDSETVLFYLDLATAAARFVPESTGLQGW